MLPRLKLTEKGLLLISVPLLFELIFVVTLAVLLKQSEEETHRQEQSKEVVAQASMLSKSLMEAGYALITWKSLRSQVFIDKYENIMKDVPAMCHHLEELSTGNRARREHVERIKSFVDRIVFLTSNFSRSQDSAALMLMNPRTYHIDIEHSFQGFENEVKALTDEEVRLQTGAPQAEALIKERLYDLLALAVCINILLAVVLAIFYTRGITNRLDVLTENAARFGKRQQLKNPVSGADEIALLDTAFHKMAEDLIKAEERKQEFVAMITHDLRTPLTTLQTSIALIEDAQSDAAEDISQQLASSRRNIARLIKLINQLLDIEKIEAGMLTIHPTATGIREIGERALDSVHDLALEKGLSINSTLENAEVQADEERIVQVVVNLLSNAVKFSPTGSTIELRTQIQTNSVKVLVEDHGCGIAQQDQSRIFDRFRQVQKDGTRHCEGTGLGLSICKSLIEAHGGQIGVDSTEGQGSSFWFTLPRPS